MTSYLSYHLPLFAIAFAGTIALQGCATKINVKEIAVDLPAGAPVNGIPFRVTGRFELDVYALNTDGKYEKLNMKTTAETLADTSRLYLLQVDGQPISQGSLTFKLNPDATIDTLKVVSTSKAQEALTELGTDIKSVVDAQAASKKADATKQTAVETALANSEDRTVAALQAKNDAELAALVLEALPVTATAVERRAAEQKVEKTRLLANQMARRAGLPAPFPATGDGA